MDFGKQHIDKSSSSQQSNGRNRQHKKWENAEKGVDFQENSFLDRYMAEDQVLQNSRSIHENSIPPRTIFGTKERRHSKRDEAQKDYKEAIEHFIASYQAYEKTRALLQEAKDTGDLEKTDYFSFVYVKDLNMLMYAINGIDQAKKAIQSERKRYSET